ncbi:methyltransferase domain-containing protein [Cellulophaga sp. E16_2]|uniref:class I SAM-dependent methyltransferase n=1 Tax=Cellulophaga sp. E16_2 TaxID=2789297 RepID=UPI001A90D918|nr:class I SAM-dependent methyltransferase [Cellulophaga sp. E16_2]MBO0590366.1 methyltransferase domain-containing protein [Cellulophaga sp. E16_2]
MQTDILGTAVLDFQNGNYTTDIKTYSSLDEEDIIPVPYLFRSYKEMPLLEKKALELAKGAILDIGCGAGSHSLYLQENGKNVTALDSSNGAIEVCKARGIKNTICTDLYDYKGEKFDTILLLMNGIGLAGKLNQVNKFLTQLKSFLNPGGQILLDSSDILYMFDPDEDGGYWIPEVEYYGEVSFEIEYQSNKSESFNWLYLDYNTLQRAAVANNLDCELIKEGEHFDYLAKLTLKQQ